MLVYEGIQLSSFAFMADYEFTKTETSPFKIPYFQNLIDVLTLTAFTFIGFLPIIMFIGFFIVISLTLIWTRVLKKKLPTLLNPIIWDMMYIPAMRSFLTVFGCTYTCKYFGVDSSFEPYVALDLFPSIHCWRTLHIVWVIFAILGIALYHPLALRFVAKDKNNDDPAMRLLPRFNVLFVVAKV
jgi:hypothetical protein